MRGEGIAVIDPHGDLALDILDAIPRSRINDVCYLDVTDTERPVGFNPATRIAPERRALAAAGIVSAFKHLWSDSWGPRLEHFLYHGIAALISRQHATLIDLPRLYTDDAFRERLLHSVTDPETLRFWREEFPSYTKILPLRGHCSDLEQGRANHRLAAAAPDPRTDRAAARPRLHDEQPAHPDRQSRQRRDRGAGVELARLAPRLAPAARRHGARRAAAAAARAIFRPRR